MPVENEQDIVDTAVALEELKDYADALGVEYRDNIGYEKLKERVDAKEEEIAAKKRAEKEAEKEVAGKKVKIIVESREEGEADQFFGFRSMATGRNEAIRIMFGEEVEVSEDMYNHIKNITIGERRFKMVPDENGVPHKQWYTKRKPRFIVSKV